MRELIRIALEIGTKKIIACAVDWPGWCRINRDEESALQTLLDYGPRYAAALNPAGIAFHPPTSLAELQIIERAPGTGTTDFGAPDAVFPSDAEPTGEAELAFFQSLLKACWSTLDAAALSAAGKELRKGPRGGGRSVDQILEHVAGAEGAYLSRLGQKPPKTDQTIEIRRAILDAVDSAVRNGLPEHGPRGGKIWTLRFFMRREAWHILDHAWEIEDRTE